MGSKMGWKTMDCAPKDGTNILIFDAKTSQYEVTYWADTSYNEIKSGFWWSERGSLAPTHWMPLPLKPVSYKL